MSACKHVATSLMNFLMDNNVRQVSMGALQQFNLDLIQCERKSAVWGKNEYLYTCTFNRFADRILKPLLRKMCVLILLLSCPWGYELHMKIFNQHIDFFLYWVWSLKKKVHVDPAWKISSHLPTQMTFLINSLEINFLHNVYRQKKKL